MISLVVRWICEKVHFWQKVDT